MRCLPSDSTSSRGTEDRSTSRTCVSYQQTDLQPVRSVVSKMLCRAECWKESKSEVQNKDPAARAIRAANHTALGDQYSDVLAVILG